MDDLKTDNKRITTVGFLIENPAEGYQKQILQGVSERAAQIGINTVLFRSNALNFYSYQFSYQRNLSMDFISRELIDVLIFPAGFFNLATGEEILKFMERYKDIPKVCYGGKIDNIPCVKVDNKSGILDMVQHIAGEHNKKRIAFVKGSLGSFDAESRMEAYIEGLKDNNIQFDPALVIQGDYTSQSGAAAVKKLLDNKIEFDAIICSDDTMAIGALEELKSRNIDVPGQVILTGFDNITECVYQSTPLTTITQQLYLQGVKAFDMAMDLINGNQVADVTLSTSLVIRNSCGCKKSRGTVFLDNQSNYLLDSRRTFVANLIKNVSNVVLVGPRYDKFLDFIGKLFDFLEKKEDNENYLNDLMSEFENLVCYFYEIDISFDFWEEMFNYLYIHDVNFLENPFFKNTMRKFYSIKDRLETKYKNKEFEDKVHKDEVMRNVVSELMRSGDRSAMLENICKWFPVIGLNLVYIYLFPEAKELKPDDQWVIPHDLNLLLSFDKSKNIYSIYPDGWPLYFNDWVSLIRGSGSSRNYIIYGFFYNELRLGYVLFELRQKLVNDYEYLLMILSNIYMNIYLLEQKEIHRRQLSELLNTLENEKSILHKRNIEMQNDISIARRIQSQLIPTKSSYPFISFYYKTMDLVGGDFFDFLEFQEKNWIGIFVSDVSGHGVAAAFVTSMIKSTIRQTRLMQDNPAYLLQSLNEALLNQTGGNFVTAFYGILMLGTSEFIYANAGHNLPYYIHDGLIDFIPGTNKSLPLGVIDNLEMIKNKKYYTNNIIRVKENSKILLYTDGLTDTLSDEKPDEDFEKARITEVILENSEQPSGQFIKNLSEQLISFHGSDDFNDDVCIICLDVPGPTLSAPS